MTSCLKMTFINSQDYGLIADETAIQLHQSPCSPQAVSAAVCHGFDCPGADHRKIYRAVF